MNVGVIALVAILAFFFVCVIPVGIFIGIKIYRKGGKNKLAPAGTAQDHETTRGLADPAAPKSNFEMVANTESGDKVAEELADQMQTETGDKELKKASFL